MRLLGTILRQLVIQVMFQFHFHSMIREQEIKRMQSRGLRVNVC